MKEVQTCGLFSATKYQTKKDSFDNCAVLSAIRGESEYIMEIIKSNIDNANKYDVYKLTKSSGAMVQDAPDGLSIPVSKWALYNDPKAGKDGQEKDNFVLSFIDNSGVKYSTVSTTFQREFADIVGIMGADPFALIVKHGQTKAGKPFVTCELDCEFRG